MSKNIVFCADGTWNRPGDSNGDHLVNSTNVYKLFSLLRGQLTSDSASAGDEQEKVLATDGKPQQVAKYLHGVGDSRNPIVKMMGGAFGAGVITRIVRGYTFISRNYQPGDRIYLIGFSRGAYTARALAGLIAAQGLLHSTLTVDRNVAYRKGAEAWYRYRKSASSSVEFTARLAEIVSDLPAFLSAGTLTDSDFVPVKEIAAVGVWDTVGAMGLPDYEGDERVDDFKFTDNKLSDIVTWGFHALSLDERREDFTPTLWEGSQKAKIKQTIFPGAHADVGGGYPTDDYESGLSDVALQWMVGELEKVGLLLSPQPPQFAPSPAGTAHQPWRNSLYREVMRSFNGVVGHCSLHRRYRQKKVLPDPKADAAPYRPKNMPVEICDKNDPVICGSDACARWRAQWKEVGLTTLQLSTTRQKEQE